MAVTFPTELLEAEVKSPAETKCFAALRDQLPEGWEVFHSAGLVVRDGADGARDDECDFVLCQPEQGIVSLEVKGGGIECNHGEGFRIDRDGKKERAYDPFAQAADHKHNLIRKIDEVDGWRGKHLFVVQALWFPDITVHELVLAPDAPPELVLDKHDLQDVPTAIERVLAYHRGARERRKAPGVEGAAMLRALLAPEVRIEVPMATLFDEEKAALVTLTSQQATIVARFGTAGRMAVVGCAGSGKTMLAMERGKRLAAQGRDVLFVCFNKALAKHLAKREAVEGLGVTHFHALCARLAGEAQIKLPSYEGTPPPEFFDEELPDALVEAVAKLGPQYDDLLADEAQDLHRNWLAALQCTLRDEEAASMWLFVDDNQRIYDADLEIPTGFQRFDLTVNCRNTQAIHNEVVKLYSGEVVPEVIGPEGRPPELILTDDQPGAVAGVIERLCGEEEIPPRDVVVLSAHGREKSEVFAAGAGRFRYVNERALRGDRVYFSSIRGFKGLESPVVILCELEDLDRRTRDHQLYVGMSRAINHCVIAAPKAPD